MSSGRQPVSVDNSDGGRHSSHHGRSSSKKVCYEECFVKVNFGIWFWLTVEIIEKLLI